MALSHGLRLIPVLLFVTSVAWGQAGEPAAPILDLASCTANATVMGTMHYSLGQTMQAAEIFQDAKSCLDKNLAGAIQDAGESADLKTAVKDFYVKAMAWCNAAGTSKFREAPARQAFDEALQRLRMEALAVGKWPKPRQ